MDESTFVNKLMFLKTSKNDIEVNDFMVPDITTRF